MYIHIYTYTHISHIYTHICKYITHIPHIYEGKAAQINPELHKIYFAQQAVAHATKNNRRYKNKKFFNEEQRLAFIAMTEAPEFKTKQGKYNWIKMSKQPGFEKWTPSELKHKLYYQATLKGKRENANK